MKKLMTIIVFIPLWIIALPANGQAKENSDDLFTVELNSLSVHEVKETYSQSTGKFKEEYVTTDEFEFSMLSVINFRENFFKINDKNKTHFRLGSANKDFYTEKGKDADGDEFSILAYNATEKDLGECIVMFQLYKEITYTRIFVLIKEDNSMLAYTGHFIINDKPEYLKL